ncbi:hypothetical protein [Opitutus terrae]|uniref:Uncharacterized protein n=1 Tax=Opitutus terrae (strain DSM 11246 / JCM 15787 / PB90-1) TaxID=452637 RepID=B1ZTS2_OPITP|nr:hypothetical protein [Opitutus terrae]ACB74858.1 conserved hypothetical protein [Opitutus terrae PB90-1]
MDTPPGSIPSPYEGLQVTAGELFPLTCPHCQRRFGDVKDYLSRTTPIFYSSGLMQQEQPGSGTFVLLVRNCLCGTSLALRCQDRRSRSEDAQRRRQQFNLLVGLLREAGVDAEAAQAEVRRLLQARTP